MRLERHPQEPADVVPERELRAEMLAHKGVVHGVEARRSLDEARAAMPIPVGVRLEAGEEGGVPGVWCRRGAPRPGLRILFLHGGGYQLGSARALSGIAAHLASRTGAEAFVPEYRLAPEHPFPAAWEDGLSTCRALSGRTDVSLVGESAGGGLALALLPTLWRQGARLPRSVAVMSPWTDLTLGGASHVRRADADPMFTREALRSFAQAYLQGQPDTDPRASPLFDVEPGLVPLRIDVGEDEVLLDDARRYAELSDGPTYETTLAIWEGMHHVFQTAPERLEAARRSLDAIARFIVDHRETR